MGGGAFYFVEYAMEVESDYGSEFFGSAGFCAARFFKVSGQAVERIVLAEKEDFVFAAEVVVEVGGGEVSGGGDFAHAGFGETSSAEFASGGAEDFEASGEVAALQAGGAHGDRMALRDACCQ